MVVDLKVISFSSSFRVSQLFTSFSSSCRYYIGQSTFCLFGRLLDRRFVLYALLPCYEADLLRPRYRSCAVSSSDRARSCWDLVTGLLAHLATCMVVDFHMGFDMRSDMRIDMEFGPRFDGMGLATGVFLVQYSDDLPGITHFLGPLLLVATKA